MPLNLPPFMVPPPCLELKDSLVASQSQGIFCIEPIGADTKFGPYIGEIITKDLLDKRKNDIDFRYAWHVNDEKTSRISHVVNATVPEKGNWMRYVNSARFFEEQNIVSVQEGSEIFYKALKDIKPGEELLTWFGPDQNKTRKRKRNNRALSASSVDMKPSSGRSSPAVTDTEPAGNGGKRLRKKKVSEDMLSLDDHDVIFASSGLHHNRIRNNASSRMRRSASLNASRTMTTRRTEAQHVNKPPTLYPPSTKAIPTPQQSVSAVQRTGLLRMSDIRPATAASPFPQPTCPASRAAKRPKSIHQIVDALKTAKQLTGDSASVDGSDDGEGDVKPLPVSNGPGSGLSGGKNSRRSSLVGTAEYMEENLVTNHQFLFEVTLTHKSVPKDAPKRIKYACDICEVQYRKPVSLKRHYLREHINQKYLSEDDVQLLTHKGAISSAKVDADVDPDADDNDTPDSSLLSTSVQTEGASENCGDVQIKQEPVESNDSSVVSKEEQTPVQSGDSTGKPVTESGEVGVKPKVKRAEMEKNLKSKPVEGKGTFSYSGTEGIHDAFRCHLCVQLFPSVEKLKYHLAQDSHRTKGDKQFACDRCNLRFRFRHNYQRHVDSHGPNMMELSTACHICGKKFLNEANMRKHLRFHSGRNFPCKYGCDVVYPNVAELVKHLRAFHPDLPKRSQLSSASGLEVPKKNLVRRPKSADEVSPSSSQSPVAVPVVKTEEEAIKEYEALHPPGWLEPRGRKMRPGIVGVQCTICKKRFSTYNSMCRHRRSVHRVLKQAGGYRPASSTSNSPPPFLTENEVSSLAELESRRTVNIEASVEEMYRAIEQEEAIYEMERENLVFSPPPSPISFYENVADNIAENLSCYLDGGVEALRAAEQHIKVDDYVPLAEAHGIEPVNVEIDWSAYNFPPFFMPVDPVIPNPPSPHPLPPSHKEALLSLEGISPAYTTRSAIAELEATRRMSSGAVESTSGGEKEKVLRRASVGALDQKLKNSEKLVRRASVGSFENQKDLTENQKDSTESQKRLAESQKDLTENQKDLTENQKDLTENENNLIEDQDLTRTHTDLTENQTKPTENQKDSTENQSDVTASVETKASAETVVDENSEQTDGDNDSGGQEHSAEKAAAQVSVVGGAGEEGNAHSDVSHVQNRSGQGDNTLQETACLVDNADEVFHSLEGGMEDDNSTSCAEKTIHANSSQLKHAEEAEAVLAIVENRLDMVEKVPSLADVQDKLPPNDIKDHNRSLPASKENDCEVTETKSAASELPEVVTTESHLSKNGMSGELSGEHSHVVESSVSHHLDAEALSNVTLKDKEKETGSDARAIVEQCDQTIPQPEAPSNSCVVSCDLQSIPENGTQLPSVANGKSQEAEEAPCRLGLEPMSQPQLCNSEPASITATSKDLPPSGGDANDSQITCEKSSMEDIPVSGSVGDETQQTRSSNDKEASAQPGKEGSASPQRKLGEESVECCQEEGAIGDSGNDSKTSPPDSITDLSPEMVNGEHDAQVDGKIKEEIEDKITDVHLDENKKEQTKAQILDAYLGHKEKSEEKVPKLEHTAPAMMNKTTDSSISGGGSDRASHDLSEKELEYLSKGMIYYVRLSKKACPHVVGKVDAPVRASRPETEHVLLRVLELAEKKQTADTGSSVGLKDSGVKVAASLQQDMCGLNGSASDSSEQVQTTLQGCQQKTVCDVSKNGLPETTIPIADKKSEKDAERPQDSTESPEDSSTNKVSVCTDDGKSSEDQTSSQPVDNMSDNGPQESGHKDSPDVSVSQATEQDNSDDELDMEIIRLQAKADIQALQEQVAIDRGQEEEMCEGCQRQTTEHGEPCRRTAEDFAKMRFGRKHPVYVVCSMCRRYYHGVESLLRHQLKKHPSIQCSYFEVENGHGLEMLFYPEPSTRGVLAESVLVPPQHVNQETYTCTRCKLIVKQYSRLRTHIINCDPNTPTTPHTRKKRPRSNRHRFMEKMLPDPVSKESKPRDTSGAVRDLSFRPKGQGGLGVGSKARTASASSSPYKSTAVSSRRQPAASTTCQTGTRSSTQTRAKSQNWRFSPSQYGSGSTKMNAGEKMGGRTRRRRNYELLYNPAAHVRRRERTECVDIHQCQGCRLSFRTLSLLERHTKNCSDKDKILNQKPIANRLSEGQGAKKHSCHYCPKRFKYLKGVYNHYNNNFCRVRAERLAGEGLSAEDHDHEAQLQALLKQQAWNKMENRDHTDVIQGRAQLLDDGTIAHTKRKGGWPKGLKRSNKRRRNGWTYIKRRKPDGSSSETSSSPYKSRSTTSRGSMELSTDSATSVAMSELEARLREPITPSNKVKRKRTSSMKDTQESSGGALGSEGTKPSDQPLDSVQSKSGGSKGKKSHKGLDDLSQAPVIDRMDTAPPVKTRDGKQMSPDLEPPTLSPIPPPNQSIDQTQATTQSKRKRKRKPVRVDGSQSKKSNSRSKPEQPGSLPQTTEIGGLNPTPVSAQSLMAPQVNLSDVVASPVLAWEQLADSAGAKGGYKLVTLKIPTVVPRIPNQIPVLSSPPKTAEKGNSKAGSVHTPEQKPLPPNFLFPSPSESSNQEQGKEENNTPGEKNESKVGSTGTGGESSNQEPSLDQDPPARVTEGRQRKKSGAVNPPASTTIKDMFKNRKSPTRKSNQKTLKSMDVYRYEKNPLEMSPAPALTPVPVTVTTMVGKSPPTSMAPLISGNSITVLPPGAMLAVLPNAPIMLQPTPSTASLTSPSTTQAKPNMSISPSLQSAVADGKVLLLDPRSLTTILAPGSLPITTQPVVAVSPSKAQTLSKNSANQPQGTSVSPSASSKSAHVSTKEDKARQDALPLPKPSLDVPNFLFDGVETLSSSPGEGGDSSKTTKKEAAKSEGVPETDPPSEEKPWARTAGKSKTKKKPKRGPPPSAVSPNGSKVKSMVMMTSPGVHTMVSLNVSPSASQVPEATREESPDTATKTDTTKAVSDADSADRGQPSIRISPARAVKKKSLSPEAPERKSPEKGDSSVKGNKNAEKKGDSSVKGDKTVKTAEKKSVLLNVPVVERRGEGREASPGRDTTASVSDEDLPLSAVAAKAKNK